MASAPSKPGDKRERDGRKIDELNRESLDIDLEKRRRVRNPLTFAAAIEVACLRFADKPNTTELHEKIYHIQDYSTWDALDEYKYHNTLKLTVHKEQH